MDSSLDTGLKTEKLKKSKLDSLLSQKKTDIYTLKQFLSENYYLIPQECRIVCWKILFGCLVTPLESAESRDLDDLLSDHYRYSKYIISTILSIKCEDDIILNYQIFLLDRGELPLDTELNKSVVIKNEFCVLFKQVAELDTTSDSDPYYLTIHIFEYLSSNVNKMKEKLNDYFSKQIAKSSFMKSLVEHERIEFIFRTAFSFKFQNFENYLMLLDHLIINSSEIFIYILILLIERIYKDQQLISILSTHEYIDVALGLDQPKLKKILKMKDLPKHYNEVSPP